MIASSRHHWCQALSRWAKYADTHTQRKKHHYRPGLLERIIGKVQRVRQSQIAFDLSCKSNASRICSCKSQISSQNKCDLHLRRVLSFFAFFFFGLLARGQRGFTFSTQMGAHVVKKKNVPQSSISLKSHHLFLTRTGAPKFIVPLCVHLSSHWEIEPFQKEPPPLFPSPTRNGDERREDISVFPPLIRLRLQSIFTVWLRTD